MKDKALRAAGLKVAEQRYWKICVFEITALLLENKENVFVIIIKKEKRKKGSKKERN